MIKLKSLIRESYLKGNPGDEFHEIYDEMQQEFHSGQKYQTWKLISAKDLILLWATFAKYGRVNEKELNKIWEIVKENVLKICINSDIRNGSDPEFFYKDKYDDITDQEWDKFFLFISDRSGSQYVRNFGETEGNARYSDGSNALYKLFQKCYSTSTTEELLLAIDSILNFVHGLGNMAKWFIEGGVKTLNQVSDFVAKGIQLRGKLSEFKKPNSRLGLCYELSGRYVSGHPESILVHGKITNPFAKGLPEVEHAWVEIGNEILDPVMDLTWPKNVYEDFFKAKIYKKYSFMDTIKITDKTGNWGPWEK